MSDLLRFGVSAEPDLVESYDRLIAGQGYATRSEAIRDLMRDALVRSRLEEQPAGKSDVLGSLTLVYDHHSHDVPERMVAIQHEHHELVISVLHVHVSHDDCMEIIALRGRASEVRRLAESLLSLKGIKHGKLFMTLPSQLITRGSTASAVRASRTHAHTHRQGKSTRRAAKNKKEREV